MKIDLQILLPISLLVFLVNMGNCAAQNLGDPLSTVTQGRSDFELQSANMNQSTASTESLVQPQTLGVYQDITQFGGPISVGGQLAEDIDVGPELGQTR